MEVEANRRFKSIEVDLSEEDENLFKDHSEKSSSKSRKGGKLKKKFLMKCLNDNDNHSSSESQKEKPFKSLKRRLISKSALKQQDSD